MSDDYSVELPAGYDCKSTTPSAGDCFTLTLRLSVSTLLNGSCGWMTSKENHRKSSSSRSRNVSQ